MKAKVFLPLVVIIYCMATVNAQYPARAARQYKSRFFGNDRK